MIQAAASTQRIKELLDEKPDVTDAPDSVSLPRLSKEITFNDVFFGYGGDHQILKGLNLTIPVNKYIALVGPSGCGKSSVLNLIMRFYDPLKGTVKFDGYDLGTVTQDSLRSQISIVHQESFLFNTTIYENIRMGKLDATEEEIEAAAKAVGIHEFIQERPEKYNTIVGERGGKLSGGQRQRIAIARAIISNPAILLLDEVTSALDPKTTNTINKTLEKIAKDRTIVSVTHKLGSAIEVDHIIVLKEGKAVEQGKHKELLNLKGVYYQMWQEFGLELTQRALVGEIDRQAEYTGVEADRLSSHIGMLETQVKTSQQKIHQLETLNQRWAQLAGTDRLTGIPNKMAFLHALVPQEIQQAQRVNAPVGFILISADNIGPINETYGRDAGDQVIREFAKLLQSIVKGEELLGHIDGTYFCIVLHPADLEATKNRAEMLRSQVASFAFPCADYSVNITASIGILSVNSNIVSDPNVTAEEIFQKLCSALYKAKRAGGNRVEITS
jgi:diguanylate cyclase (GGDEF)-like protein